MENQSLKSPSNMPYYPFLPFMLFYNPIICSSPNSGNNFEQNIHKNYPPPESIPSNTTQYQIKKENIVESQPTSQNVKRRVQRCPQSRQENRRKQDDDEYRPPYQRNNRKKSTFFKGNTVILRYKIKQMLIFLKTKKKSLVIINRYLQQSGMKVYFKKKRFYSYLKMKKKILDGYITLNLFKTFLEVEPGKSSLFSIKEQQFYLKLFRVVLRYYIQNVSPVCSLTSTKIHSKRKIHFKFQRQLLAFLEKGLHSDLVSH